MFLQITLLLVGFIVLIKGADFLVGGASSIAKKFNISNLVIGLTVVAFGTSTPELIVSSLSAINGNGDAAFGNVIGSNNFNILFILGVAGLIYPLVVQRNTVKFEVPISLLAALLVYILVNDQILWGTVQEDAKYNGVLSRLDSAILLAFFVLFMFYVYKSMKTTSNIQEDSKIKLYTTPVGVGLVVLGMVMLIGGGKLVVDSAVFIAKEFGLSERLIGLTILAAGTSLPELATSAVAAYRKNTDIAIGNVIGSNIFNLLLILGVTGLIHPINFNAALNFDLEVLGMATIVTMVFMFTINKRTLDRWEAFILLCGYVAYIFYLITNDTF